jgi:type IV secretory pathway VirB4 component
MLKSRTTTGAHGSVLGPAGLQLRSDRLRTSAGWQASFAVVGYPHEVSRGWLAPLLQAARDTDLALHIEPLPAQIAADRLRRQRARFESTRRLERDRGQLPDPFVAAAAEDSEQLMRRLARGQSKLFRAGLYLSVHAASEAELDERVARLRALCSSLLLHVVSASFRPFEGWLSTLPLGVDQLRLRRSFDSEALAASYPFAAADPPLDPNGTLYGLTPSGAPIVLDRFAGDNYNTVLLARSGAGKSYAAKLEALRLLYRGVQVFVIDPENEFERLTHAVGGVYLPLAGTHAVTLNPLDLPSGGSPDSFDERALFLTDLVTLLLGSLNADELPVLDRAIRACYAAAGITPDPATHGRPAPLLRDLADTLAADPDGNRLADRLQPYASGSHARLFSQPTSARPDNQLVCFSLRGLHARLQTAALFLTLDAVWRSLEGPLRKRCVLVDEAWLLMREPAGAAFLNRLAKSARKRWCGLTTISQDADDLLGSDLGRAIVNNASSQILLRQSPQAIEQIGQAFNLTAGERQHLLTCATGHGLLIAGDQRLPLHVIASPQEHRLVTSDPAELTEDDPVGEVAV